MNKIKDLQEIFRDIFNDETLILTEKTSSNDIDEWDSLAQINLILAIQDVFKITFDLEEIFNIKNVGNICELIENKKQIK